MGIRPFSDTLAQLRFGELSDELSDQLNALTTACSETGKAGTLTLSIKIKPGKAGQMEIEDDVKVKMPQLPRGSTLMFATPEGNLQRENPKQMSLEGLREVAKPVAPKEVAHG